MARPTFTAEIDDPKMFMIENKDGETFPIRFIKALVIVTTASGERVAFGKNSRGQNFWDSRGKQVRVKDDWDNVTFQKRPLMITENEVQAELERLLDDRWEATRAFRMLNV
jgi:hypothetical protein